jgi:hypothetical protein
MFTIAEDDVAVLQGGMKLGFINPMDPHFVLGPLVDDELNYRHVDHLASLDDLRDCITPPKHHVMDVDVLA